MSARTRVCTVFVSECMDACSKISISGQVFQPPQSCYTHTTTQFPAKQLIFSLSQTYIWLKAISNYPAVYHTLKKSTPLMKLLTQLYLHSEKINTFNEASNTTLFLLLGYTKFLEPSNTIQILHPTKCWTWLKVNNSITNWASSTIITCMYKSTSILTF